MASVFSYFRDSPQRRRALRAPPDAAERYALFGFDQLRERGWATRHNLERDAPPAWARAAGGTVKRALEAAGGYGGDFATVLASLREANRADVVFSTVDTVGIPLMLAKRRGLAPPAARLRRDRSPGAARPPSLRAHAAPVRVVPRVRVRGRDLQRARGGRARQLPRGAPARDARRVRAVRRRHRGVRTDRTSAGGGRGLGRSRSAPRLRAPPRRRSESASNVLRARDVERARAGARPAARERARRFGSSVRCDARAPRAGTGRRAAGPREQLLGRDDRAPAGDGAREAGRRHAHGRDRHGLRARRRRERPARGAGRRRRRSPRQS